MAKNFGSRTKAFFEKAFPERQIYHRSGGSVRYVSISPWRQAMMAGAATVVVGWCLFATVAVLLRGPAVGIQSGASERKVARLERDVRQAKAAEQTALSLLENRTKEFDQHIDDAKRRHDTLKVLLAHLQGQDAAQTVALNGSDTILLVDSSIEEADARQGRDEGVQLARSESAGFRAKIDNLKYQQAGLLDAAEDEAADRAERARGVIRLTGAPFGQIVQESAMGGPLIDISADAFGRDDVFGRRVQEVAARLDEANRFETLIHTLPLGAPVGVPFRETSGFGNRLDPFNRRLAWHEGADFAAYPGAPLIATAPGTVSFAGTKSSYGRVVEIDHGGGFKTRFAHMQAIAVTAGSKVAIGQKIGTMGSTGRSTGPHLHYEVYFRGKAYDPMKFLRAGRHVHEG